MITITILMDDKWMVNDFYTHYTIVASHAIDSTILWPNMYSISLDTFKYLFGKTKRYLSTYLLTATCSKSCPRLIDDRSLNDVCRPINLHSPITGRIGEQYNTAVYTNIATIYNILCILLYIYNRHGQITIINNSYHV